LLTKLRGILPLDLANDPRFEECRKAYEKVKKLLEEKG
jgi:hypothetical protein